LTYVGITRARYQLFVPYVEETQVIRKLAALVWINWNSSIILPLS